MSVRYRQWHAETSRYTPPTFKRQRMMVTAVLSFLVMVGLAVVVVISTLYIVPPKTTRSVAALPAGPTATATGPLGFDPNVDAPLPYNRIVAAYGIFGGTQANGPASTLDMLNSYMPQLQQLGQQYAALDPTHPVKLALDFVINVLQPCYGFEPYCSSFPALSDIQPFVDFCQQNNMLLFLDFQLGTMPVKEAMTRVQPLLTKYSFVEIALDTEFHWPNTPAGHADAEGYPNFLGWMGADEINWALNDLAQISLQNHLPRKVLLVHQWNPAVLHDKNKVQPNPNVSLVLQSDGFGYTDNKLGDYQIFVQQALWEYGGYKLFYHYDNGIAYDIPLQTPQQIMQLFPQPLFISYQ